jgi:hypothetical protein
MQAQHRRGHARGLGDFKTFTFRIKPGIYFADDPAFKGRGASWWRPTTSTPQAPLRPALEEPNLYMLENAKILGLSELRRRRSTSKKPFDYDTRGRGLRALDRYTFQVRLGQARAALPVQLRRRRFTGALAREVVEAYGDKIGEHPVGTGPFRLASGSAARASCSSATPTTARCATTSSRRPATRGCRPWPRGSRAGACRWSTEVQIAIIEEQQPRWLSFLNGEHDLLENCRRVRAGGHPQQPARAQPGQAGIQMVRYPRADVTVSTSAWSTRWWAATTPDKVALRRAIALAYHVEREIRLVRRGQADAGAGPVAARALAATTRPSRAR